MPAPDFLFGGASTGDVVGVTGVPAYGQREKFLFSGAWLVRDLWQVTLVSTEGDITLGSGTFSKTQGTSLTSLAATTVFTFRNREYVGLGTEFAFSDNGDPTSFETQAAGAGFVTYLSYFGSQDNVTAFQQLQGRLVVFGSRSIQIWTVDADPANFNLVQEMDNIGTQAPLSAQNIGDYDVIFLDQTGFRSVRQREVTLNAYVDDVGIAVDSLVEDDLTVVAQSTCCSVVDPSTKRYWGYLNGKIYILSRYPSSKITAWSTYDCVDSKGIRFIPVKFIVFNGIVYCRTADNRLIAYGGETGSAYDGTVMTVEFPWLDNKQPKMIKYSKGIDVACAGQWHITISMDPKSFVLGAAPLPVFDVAGAIGDESGDSSFDLQNIGFEQRGTHWKLIAKTDKAWTDYAALSEIQFHYNESK